MLVTHKLSPKEDLYHKCDNMLICHGEDILVDATISAMQGRCPYCHVNLQDEYNKHVQDRATLEGE